MLGFTGAYILILLGTMIYASIDSHIRQKDQGILFFLFAIFFSVFVALRPVEVADTQGYIYIFDRIPKTLDIQVNFLKEAYGVEFGFIFLVQMFKLFSDNARLFFFLTTFTTFCFLFSGFRIIINDFFSEQTQEIKISNKSKKAKLHSGFLIVLILSYWGIAYCTIAIRAGLSMAFGLYGFALLNRKKRLFGFIFLFLGFTMQRMAIMMMIACIVSQFGNLFAKKGYIVFWILLFLLLVTGISQKLLPLFAGLVVSLFEQLGISGYETYIYAELGTRVGLKDYMWLFVYGVLIMFGTDSPKYKMLLNIFTVGICIEVLFVGFPAMARVYDYFYVFAVPLLYDIYYRRFSKNSIGRKFVACAVISMFLFLTFSVQLKIT